MLAGIGVTLLFWCRLARRDDRLMLVYIAVRWEDSGLGETLALGAYGLMGVVVAAYSGGAAYQDVKIYPKLMSLEDKENGIEEDIDDTIDNDQYREEENNV